MSRVDDKADPAALIGRSHQLEQLADILEVGGVFVDDTLVIRGWNRWMEVATEIAAAEAVGKPLTQVFPGIAGTARERAFVRAVSGEIVVFAHSFHEYLLPVPAESGFDDFQFMQQSARLLPAYRDEHHGAIAVITDVTERIARERALVNARQLAETANKAKADFLTAMSHEFRTPLNAILGYASLLESEISGPLNQAQQEHLHRMVLGTRHLVNMIEEILTFATVEAQKQAVTVEPVDVADVAKDVVTLLEQQAREKDLALGVECDPPSIVINTDPRRLKQILVNVVANAIKFTDTGAVKVRISDGAPMVTLAVTDTGPGIPAEHRQSIFEPFVQVHGVGKQGTGLGLPLSRSLAEMIGGVLELGPSEGKGTTFLLKLPRAR